MECPYCPPFDLAVRVLLRNDAALFIEDERDQGALEHSGVILPVAHRPTAFDLTVNRRRRHIPTAGNVPLTPSAVDAIRTMGEIQP